MKITNRLGLPQLLVDLAGYERTGYRLGDITVTEMNSAPQQLELCRRYDDVIEVDAADRLWVVWGNAVHHMLRMQPHDNALVEERLGIDVNGWRVTGQIDLYEEKDGGTISDWKTTSAWSVIYKSRDPEWSDQQNSYAHIMRAASFPVAVVQTIPMLRDWSLTKAVEAMEGKGSYPAMPLRPYPLPLWTPDQCEGHFGKRVTLHQRARQHHEWPPCSPEERWQRGDKWSVKKAGNKKATAVFGPGTAREGGEEEAWVCRDLMAQAHLRDTYAVERQEAEPMRCMKYCDVGGLRDFCPQWVADRPNWAAQTLRLNTMLEAA